jgi:hypothetical protein
LAESAIIATDIAEVTAGSEFCCEMPSLMDIFSSGNWLSHSTKYSNQSPVGRRMCNHSCRRPYNPSGSMQRLRYFEYFVISLVLGVTICFSIQLSYIEGASVGEVFKGYLPSSAIVQAQGYDCGNYRRPNGQ